VRPVTVQLVVEVVQVKRPGVEVTVYPVIAEPPLLAGADQEMVIDESPNTASTDVGASGAAAGVIAPEVTDPPSPTALEAYTEKV
jgi:hypothetical protein